MATIRDIMTPNPITLTRDTPVLEAARRMQRDDIGDVVVTDNGSILGIVTDRDIVIRAIANGRDPQNTRVGDICSTNPVTITPDDDIRRAIELMRDNAIRRLPVVQNGKLMGIVSLGDLAVDRDPNSVLGEVSSAPPQH